MHYNVICYATCTNEGWNTCSIIFCATFANEIELVQMRGGTLYNIHYITCADEVDSCSGTQGATLNYHGKIFRPITDPQMHNEGDRAHNNIIYCKKLYVQLGGVYRTTCEGIKDGTHGQIWMDNVNYTGLESSLIECPQNVLGNHNCGHSEDAGVRCQGKD